MKKVAIILSGCGHLDGSEIRESVLTLLALDIQGISYEFFAPNVNQFNVVNHQNGEPLNHTARNVLQEANRIARGEIQNLKLLDVKSFDGLIIPGGFGVTKNLSNFATVGVNAKINSDLTQILKSFNETKKPIGAICIAPVLLALTFKNPIITLGTHPIDGINHVKCLVNDCVVDSQNLLVSRPAYMDSQACLSDIYEGISKLVKKMIMLCNKLNSI